MKLYIGPAGDCLATKGQGAPASFAHLKSLGLNSQELEFVQQVYVKPEAAAGIGQAARDNGIHVSIHAPYYVNLCTEDAEKLVASRKRISDSLDRAERMAAPGPVAFHPGFFQERSKKECFDAVVESVGILCREHPGANLGLETTGKHSAFGSLEENLEVCKAVKAPNAVVVIDFAHLYARAMGHVDFGSVLDTLLSYGHRELYAHFSGINYSKAGELNHLPLSSNSPPFSGLAKALKERENKLSKASIVCETPLLEQDCLEMKKIAEKAGLPLTR